MDKKPIEIEDGWSYMEKGITKLKRILEGDPNEESFDAEFYMMLYTMIYNMCTQKPPHDYSEQLYSRYRDAFNIYINETVLPSLRDLRDETLLRELHKRWQNHNVMIRWLSRFFNYLDRYYITRHSLSSLSEVGLICFRDQVYVEMKRKARDAVLSMVEREREGEQIDRALLKNVLDIFIAVGMGQMDTYQHDFEDSLLTETAAYYKRKAAMWIQQDSCPDYMLKAEDCLRAEEERVNNYLHQSSKTKLLEQVEREVLSQYESELLEKEHSGCAALLNDDKKDDLARMYRLFQRIPKGLDPVAELFRKHVESEGMQRVKEATETAAAKKEKDAGKGAAGKEAGGVENTFMREVVELHDKYMEYVVECFMGSSLFHKALKEAFEAFCNKQVAGCTIAEIMANFCNNLLKRGGAEKLSDEDIEATLEKVIKLLAFISDKDLFAEFYRKRLSRRLLVEKSSAEHHERAVLAQLKQQCGAQFTSKMEGMVQDLQLAREMQQRFEDWKRERGNAIDLDVSVTVLTTGYWPTYKAVELVLPKEMADGIQQFRSFYETGAKNRRLQWIYGLGCCTLKGNFDAKPVELVCSTTFHAAVLLQFNTDPELKYAELAERLNLADEDLMRTLHSLSCAKYRILNKAPEGRSIGKEDVFSVNRKFTDRMRRIKITLPAVDEKKKVIEDVDKDRKYAIDAAIVRTMKSRKVLNHQHLILEVVGQLQRMFNPDLRMIKKRIEDLISREYIERDPEQTNQYRYMA